MASPWLDSTQTTPTGKALTVTPIPGPSTGSAWDSQTKDEHHIWRDVADNDTLIRIVRV